jgi:hypothetical protein
MATIYRSTGKHAEEVINLPLPDIEARLLANRYGTTADDITHTPTDRPPQLAPVTKWHDYVLIQVYDSEPKTKLFPKSGSYHLRQLSINNAGFLLIPKE